MSRCVAIFYDATHPVWGLQVLNYRWLLRGQRLYVGVGGGRKRLSILGGWCPEDHEYLDLRLPDSNVNAQTFIDFMNLLRTRHPETKRFILYLDNARYFHAVMARAVDRRHAQAGRRAGSCWSICPPIRPIST